MLFRLPIVNNLPLLSFSCSFIYCATLCAVWNIAQKVVLLMQYNELKITIANCTCNYHRVPTPPGKSWIFFLENSRTWKVLENHFGPGKSWKLKLKVLESPGKISLKVMHFSSGSNGKQAAIV